MSLNNPDFEEILSEALGIHLTQVKQKTIKYSTSAHHPGAKVIHRTTVISVIEKQGRTSNLPIGGTR